MASTYNLEPNPTAKVLLQTTTGDLEIELFAKQTPKTSRNFLQLCLDGYYENTVFHRLVKGFIIQGGDPTGTGQGGESSYDGEPFKDEFHSRLKFNRRGLLGMASTGKPDDNGSQFFFTLGNTPELQGKNTLFGRIAGDTIYNLMKMAEAEIADSSEERPMYPTKITGTEVIVNPFEDMVKRTQVAERTAPEEKKTKKPKRKAGKQLLSFGEDEGEAAPVAKKPKFNAALVSAGEEKSSTSNNSAFPKPENDSRIMSAWRQNSASPLPPPPPKSAPSLPSRPEERSPAPSLQDEKSEHQSRLDRVNAQIAAVKASMKRNAPTQPTIGTKKTSLLDSMIPASTTKGRKRGVPNAASEKASLDMLAKFKSKLEAAPAADTRMDGALYGETLPTAQSGIDANGKNSAFVDEEEAACDLHFVVGCQSCKAWDLEEGNESDDDTGWMSHSLSFARDRLGKDLEWKRKNEEELIVIDPLERAKEIKAQKREQGKAKREWDMENNDRRQGLGFGTR